MMPGLSAREKKTVSRWFSVKQGQGSFQGACTLLAGTEVLGMIHLHEEEFQVLARHILIGNKEVKSIVTHQAS